MEPLGSGQVVLKCVLTAKQACLQADFRMRMIGAFFWFLFVEMLARDAGLFQSPLILSQTLMTKK